jgi:hypothetical protein
MSDSIPPDSPAMTVAQRRNKFNQRTTIPDLKPLMRDRFGDYYQAEGPPVPVPSKGRHRSNQHIIKTKEPQPQPKVSSNQLPCNQSNNDPPSGSILNIVLEEYDQKTGSPRNAFDLTLHTPSTVSVPKPTIDYVQFINQPTTDSMQFTEQPAGTDYLQPIEMTDTEYSQCTDEESVNTFASLSPLPVKENDTTTTTTTTTSRVVSTSRSSMRMFPLSPRYSTSSDSSSILSDMSLIMINSEDSKEDLSYESPPPAQHHCVDMITTKSAKKNIQTSDQQKMSNTITSDTTDVSTDITEIGDISSDQRRHPLPFYKHFEDIPTTPENLEEWNVTTNKEYIDDFIAHCPSLSTPYRNLSEDEEEEKSTIIEFSIQSEDRLDSDWVRLSVLSVSYDEHDHLRPLRVHSDEMSDGSGEDDDEGGEINSNEINSAATTPVKLRIRTSKINLPSPLRVVYTPEGRLSFNTDGDTPTTSSRPKVPKGYIYRMGSQGKGYYEDTRATKKAGMYKHQPYSNRRRRGSSKLDSRGVNRCKCM